MVTMADQQLTKLIEENERLIKELQKVRQENVLIRRKLLELGAQTAEEIKKPTGGYCGGKQ